MILQMILALASGAFLLGLGLGALLAQWLAGAWRWWMVVPAVVAILVGLALAGGVGLVTLMLRPQ